MGQSHPTVQCVTFPSDSQPPLSCGNTMENHAGPQTPLHLTASVKQTLKDRESGELDTFLTVELAQAASEYLGLTILLEPRPVVERPQDVPVNRFRKLWSSLSVCAGRSGQVSGQVGSSRLLTPGSARSRVAPCQHHSQTPFTSVCPRHREYGGHSGLDCIDGRPEDNFVMQLPEENAQYLVYRDRKQIYLDWLPGQKTRRVKLIFICSNRCFVETETEYYINLKISLEEPISGDLKGYDTVAVIPP